MKVLWVYFDIGTGNCLHYNHGVGSVDACLRAAGHDTALDYNRVVPTEEHAAKVLAREKPDAVFFPVNTHQWMFARQYAKWVRRHSKAATLVGGIHAILDPEPVIAAEAVDAVCIGEGEHAAVEYLEALCGARPPESVEGIWFRLPDGSVLRNPFRHLIEDLDSIPISDREIWNYDAVLVENGYELQVMGGRGCPFNCTYCANSARRKVYRGHGKFVRMCSPERLIEQIAAMERRYVFGRVFVEDDVFIFDHEWAGRFCALYRERFDYPFQAYVRVEFCTKEILRAMRDAGCYRILIGVEAGNEHLRTYILNRKMKNEDIVRVFRWADELGLQTWNFNMFGFPDETAETIEDLFALNREIRPNKAQISLFYPYPNTRLHEICRERGLITGDERASYFEESILSLPTVSREHLVGSFWRFREMALTFRAEKEAKGYLDFTTLLAEAGVRADSADGVRLHICSLNGLEEVAIFQHPRSSVTIRADVAPGSVFRARIALDPLCYAWGGAGVWFRLLVNGREVFSRYLDPKSDPEQRRWHDVRIPLDWVVGKGVAFTFITEPPESGELVGAWSVWGRPHLTLADPSHPYAGAIG